MISWRKRKICGLHEFKSIRKIEKVALRRATQNSQRPRDLQSLSTRGDDALLVIHQQQISMKLDRKSNRGSLTCV